MDTNRAMTLSSLGYSRLGELLIYSMLVAVLIGQIFLSRGNATWYEAELVLLGGVLGIMVSCAVTPLHNLFVRHRTAHAEWQWFKDDNSQSTVEPRSSESQVSQEEDTTSADRPRRAA